MHESCEDIIRSGWQQNVKLEMKNLAAGIENCVIHLSKRTQTVFGNLSVQIRAKQKELEGLMGKPVLVVSAVERYQKELAELTHREEIMWKQKANEHYIKEGDRNTRYFHLTASRRK